MKILLVVTDCEVGGITTSSYNLCNELYHRGHDVTFLDMSTSHKAEEFLHENITKKYFKGISKYWKITSKTVQKAKGVKKIALIGLAIIKKLTNRCGLWNEIIFQRNNKEVYDVAIAFRQCAPCYDFVLKRVKADKKLAFVHGDVDFMEGNEKFFLPYMPKFNKVAYVSDAAKENFLKKHPFLKENACVVYNMFNVEDILAKSKMQDILQVEQDKKIIVTVARIDNDIKQIYWIPHICQQLKQRNCIPFYWYVIGGGPELTSNIELARALEVEDVLKFVGERTNPFVLESKADFTVLVSKTEAYPMTIMESFILKKPVITTEFCAAREMVISGKNGMIVKQNIDDVTEGIIHFLNDTDGIYTKSKEFLEGYYHTNENAYQQLMKAIEL